MFCWHVIGRFARGGRKNPAVFTASFDPASVEGELLHNFWQPCLNT